MELVTGRSGSPHITSQQDRQLHQGIFGDGAYILNTGNTLEPEVQSSNSIHIKDGALMFQGALFSVKVGTYVAVAINNGNHGMKRKDVIAVKYTYDSSQNIEAGEWTVVQGTPVASNPVIPDMPVADGDIQAGDSEVYCPVFVVTLDGINVTGVDVIPDVMGDMSTINKYLSELPLTADMFAFQSFYNVMFLSGKKIGKTLYFSAEIFYTGQESTIQPNQFYKLNNASSVDSAVIPKDFNVLQVTATDGAYTHAVNGFAMINKSGQIEFSFPSDPVAPTYVFISGIYEAAN